MIKVCSSDKYGNEVWNEVHVKYTVGEILGGIAMFLLFALIAVILLWIFIGMGRIL